MISVGNAAKKAEINVRTVRKIIDANNIHPIAFTKRPVMYPRSALIDAINSWRTKKWETEQTVVIVKPLMRKILKYGFLSGVNYADHN